MAVHSSVFGGIELTGEDAKVFRQKVEESKPNECATKAYQEGQEMVREFKEHGFVRVKLGSK